MEETSPVIPNSQNDCQPQVRLPTYSQIEAGVPQMFEEIDAPSVVTDKDGNPAVNPDQRNSDSVDSDLEVGEYDEKLEGINESDSGDVRLEYHDDGHREAVENEEPNPMVPNDKLVTTLTGAEPQSLHDGNQTPIIVHSSPRWRPPGRY
ncbi:MAG: hypothetical protein LQ349_009687 [Xanthoria aureola]|nr:MAG: hypothetical protein LQ349_009687 [Xanthoria aureola]